MKKYIKYYLRLEALKLQDNLQTASCFLYKLARSILFTATYNLQTTTLKNLLSLCCILITTIATAQIYPVQVTPQLIPPYSLKLSDYETTTSEKLFVNILLTDATETGRQVRLKMYIEGQGLNIQTLDFVGGATPIFLDGGVNRRLSNLDLRPYFNINNLLGISPQQYSQTLPDGRYNFCFEVFDFTSGQPLSRKSCIPAFLLLNDPPFLNVPNRGELVAAQNPQNILFNWTPRHLNATGVQYEFTIKELWDAGLDPQAAFLAAPPLYQTTTFATTLLYGPADIQLLPGKTYGWQIRALVSDGISETSVFRNNGYSEIFHFTYQANCDSPQFVLSEALNERAVRISWQYGQHLRYEIQYRKKGYDDSDWFDLYSYNSQSDIQNLEAGTTYQFRVGGECVAQGGFSFSNMNQFTTPTEEETAYYNCGVLPEINIANQNKLQNIGVNESFTAGDFPVTVKEVRQQGDNYTGWGFIIIPYLADTKIRVEFENIAINTDNQLIQGVVETSYDANWEGIGDIDNLIDDLLGDDGEINTFDATTIDIAEAVVDENGNIILIDENGNPHPIEVDTPVVITDANGDQWAVDEDGLVTPLGEVAEGGAASADNTSGIGANGSVNQITSNDINVLFTPSGFYATDVLRQDIQDNKFTKNYESIPQASGGDYEVLYKAISNKPSSEDELVATATFANGKTSDDIIFKTKQGTAIQASWSGNIATLKLKKQHNFAKDEILATVKRVDSTSNYTIAGKANIWHLQQQLVNVTVVPVNGFQSIDENSLASDLNAIYNPVGVHFNITVDSPFSIDPNVWDIENTNGQLDIGDSDMLANYTIEERAIYNHYKVQRTTQSQMYYVFILGSSITTTDSGTEGFMPLKRQFGFVFNTSNKTRTLAHELGHGVFGLEHPFTDYDITRGSTNLLMDYGTGTALTHMDWQTIHAPGLQLYIFQGDEAGESVTSSMHKSLSINEKKYSCIEGNCVEDDNGKYYYGYLTPSGKRIVLSQDYTPTFYHGIENDKYTHIIPGTLIGFNKKSPLEGANTKYRASLSNNGESFSGYNNGFSYSNLNIEGDDNTIVMGIPYAGTTDADNAWKNYKFAVAELNNYEDGNSAVLKINSDEFKNYNLFRTSQKPVSSRTISKIDALIGEEQFSITNSEFKILSGKYFEIPGITDFTTLIEGIITRAHDEKPEVFLIIKIAEIQNRYPVLFEKYSNWFDRWNVYELVHNNYLPQSVTRAILDQILSFSEGKWEIENINSTTLNDPSSEYRKWKDNMGSVSDSNAVLYDFYRTFLAGLREYTDGRSEDNLNCLNNLQSESYRNIIDCVEIASNDEIAQINFENRTQALKTLISTYRDVDFLRNKEETVVTRLVKYTPSSFDEDQFFSFLTNPDNKVTVTDVATDDGDIEIREYALWNLMFDKIDNAELFFTGDNRETLIYTLLKHYYKSNDFINDFNNIQEYLYDRTLDELKDYSKNVYEYEHQDKNIVARGWAYVKRGFSDQHPLGFLYEYNPNTDKFLSIDTEVVDINEISVEHNLKWGFNTPETKFTSSYGPFELVMFKNTSREQLLKQFTLKDESGNPQAFPVPALVLHYASETSNEETKTQIIQTSIDVATLFIPAANLTTLGRIFYYADKVSSVTSILATGTQDENPELQDFFNKLSLATGVLSLGDLVVSSNKLKDVVETSGMVDNFQPVKHTAELADYINSTNVEVLNKIKPLHIQATEYLLKKDIEDFRKARVADEATIVKLETALSTIRELADTHRGVTKSDFVSSVRNFPEDKIDEAWDLFGQEKFDELYAFFKNNGINYDEAIDDVWPPADGFKNILRNDIPASDFVGAKFDRFQVKPSLGGSYSSPIKSREKVGELYYTYDSRMMAEEIVKEGTYYFEFKISENIDSSIKFTKGEIASWFARSRPSGEQIKTSIPFHRMAADSFNEVTVQQLISGAWRKCIVDGKEVSVDLQNKINKITNKELADGLVDYINRSPANLDLFKNSDLQDDLIDAWLHLKRNDINILNCN